MAKILRIVLSDVTDVNLMDASVFMLNGGDFKMATVTSKDTVTSI